MLQKITGFRLNAAHEKKLSEIKHRTGLNSSEVVRRMIMLFDLDVHSRILTENEKPATGLVSHAKTVNGFVTMN